MAQKVRIVFHPFNRLIEVENGTTILEAIRQAGLQVESICGGKGECRKCKVILTKGTCAPFRDQAQKGLSPKEVELGYVLSCQVQVDSNCEVTIPVESRIDTPKILVETTALVDEIYPGTSKYEMTFAEDQYMPFSGGSIRMPEYTGPRPRVKPSMYKDITECKEACTVTVSWTNRYPEIVRLEKQKSSQKNYGIAIDLGTTTIVALLVDLGTGSVIARESTMNGQITYGEELVTRLAFTHSPEGLKKLQTAAINSVNTVIGRLVKDAGISIEEVNDVCVGGNTVMNHLITGRDPRYLEMADAKVSHRPLVHKARDLGLDLNPEIYLYCLPNVSRFVGGDAVGDVLTSGMHTSDDTSLLIDLGTNGEIILGNREWLASASCASGPAFEGSGITHGMRAMKGAIEHVVIDPITREAQVTTIEGQRPKGICGSGFIDAVTEMYRSGVLDFAGKIV
ncbi:MAG: ASKHA domain-containing protein, partial [Methanoregulaceae archaeon]|nr:ASKHA domain-containing protein [Methanoregulaceae archaeon]